MGITRPNGEVIQMIEFEITLKSEHEVDSLMAFLIKYFPEIKDRLISAWRGNDYYHWQVAFKELEKSD